MAMNRGVTTAWREDPTEHPHAGGLPRPIGTEKTGNLTTRNLHGHIVDRRQVAKLSGQMVGFDQKSAPKNRATACDSSVPWALCQDEWLARGS